MSVTVTPPAVGGAAGGSRTGCATLCDLSRHGSRVLHGALPPTKSHPLPRMWCQPSNGCPRYSTLPRDLHARGPPHPIAPDLSLLRNRRRGSLRRTYPAAICLPQRSADWTDTVTMPCSATEQNSAPLPRFTSESSGPPSDSPDNDRYARALRGVHLSSFAETPLSPDVSRMPMPQHASRETF